MLMVPVVVRGNAGPHDRLHGRCDDGVPDIGHETKKQPSRRTWIARLKATKKSNQADGRERLEWEVLGIVPVC